MTTDRTTIASLNSWMAASGSALSASYSPYLNYREIANNNSNDINNINTGKVGINQANPQYTLDVSGTINTNFCNVNGLYVQREGLTNINFTADNPPGAFVILLDTTSSCLAQYDIAFPPKFGDGIYMISNNDQFGLNHNAAHFGMFMKNKNFTSSYIPSNNDYSESVGMYMYGFYSNLEGTNNDLPIYIGGHIGDSWDGATIGTHPVTLTISSSYVGISNTNPTYKLDVNGTGRFSANVSVTGSVSSNINNAIGFYGTASYANTSSIATSSSYALTASYAGNTKVVYTQQVTSFITGTPVIFNHTLGVVPSYTRWVFTVQIATGGFNFNDEIDIHSVSYNAPEMQPVCTTYANSSVLGLCTYNVGSYFPQLACPNGTAPRGLTANNMSLGIKVYYSI